PVHAGGDRQVAALVYTSGTSGNPKGVMLTHRNLCFVAGNNRVNRRMTPEDKVYGVLPISHVYGLASITVSTLHSGGCLVLEPRFDPGRVARALAEDGITILHGVPAMYAKLLEWGRRPGNRLAAPRLRVAQGGGAPLDQNFKDEFEATFGLPLHNGYGMTESSPSIAQTRLDAPRRDCAVGPPIPGLEIRIVKEGVGVAPGEVGELHVRGPNVMAGYYRAPELTREAVDAEGWLNTGDLARQAPDGALYIVGRAKELIIRSGFNVYPVEVEQVINGHPEVVHSAVVGRHVPGNEEVVAYVEPVPGSRLTAGELAAWLAGVLSPYKRPSEIVILDHLPATATGKILKNALRQMAARGAD
ncbi:MAG TPA: AMP-binding protein, partial [Rhodocyclaceae bacterium]|nr:AMP-binding protein [Rhodocyclaceae bacterium]